MKREETVDYNIKVIWHAISRMYNQEAIKHELTTSMGFVLLNIDFEAGTPATKIAPALGLESRSLTRMLKAMEEKNLIYKEPDPLDKRSVRIFLTEEGKKKREVSAQTVKVFNNKVRSIVSKKKLTDFFAVINEIGKVIEDINKQDSLLKQTNKVTIN